MSIGALGTSLFGTLDAQPQQQSLPRRICEGLKIVFTDLLPANLTCVLPNAFSWCYRTLWTGSIQSHTVSVPTTTKTASLFAHGMQKPAPTSAVLLLHGDHSHPMTLLHLADIAQAQGRAVFSVHLPYDDSHPEAHRALLGKCIEKIGQILSKNGGSLSHLLLAGHSRGALEATHEALVKENPAVNGILAMAGRFRVIKPSLRPCRESLEPSVNAVWDKLHLSSRPLRVPFLQVAAQHDWCMDPEASVVRPDQRHLYVNAGHLGVINHPSTLKTFKAWVAV